MNRTVVSTFLMILVALGLSNPQFISAKDAAFWLGQFASGEEQ